MLGEQRVAVAAHLVALEGLVLLLVESLPREEGVLVYVLVELREDGVTDAAA